MHLRYKPAHNFSIARDFKTFKESKDFKYECEKGILKDAANFSVLKNNIIFPNHRRQKVISDTFLT